MTPDNLFSSEQIRRQLRMYARLFIEENVCYNDDEKLAVERIIDVVQEVDDYWEEVKRRHKEENY